MRRGLQILVVFLALYAGLMAVALAYRRDLIYPFSERVVDLAQLPGFRAVPLQVDGGNLEIDVLLSEPRGNAPVILYFMGNFGSLAFNEEHLRALAGQGFGIAAMSFRGGGGQAGMPSEAALFSDARALYDALDELFSAPVPASRRVVYGFSLGSGIATSLATEREVAALVLEAPYTSVCEIAQYAYRVLAACAVMWDERYDSVSRIGDIGAPLLVLHGTGDMTIPQRFGRALFDAAREPKQFISYEGGRHYNLMQFGAVEDMAEFLLN